MSPTPPDPARPEVPAAPFARPLLELVRERHPGWRERLATTGRDDSPPVPPVPRRPAVPAEVARESDTVSVGESSGAGRRAPPRRRERRDVPMTTPWPGSMEELEARWRAREF